MPRSGSESAEHKSPSESSRFESKKELKSYFVRQRSQEVDMLERFEMLEEFEIISPTRQASMKRLKPGRWLDDGVLNVYMELLKDREKRAPGRFLTCHFFSTFFYAKLYSDQQNYNFNAVKGWTSLQKLGYRLADCDKIIVPIHQEYHWCLAVIHIREQRLEYLDSLRGEDTMVLENLARYIADEARDKEGTTLDTLSWTRQFPTQIPEQQTTFDCGVFVAKFADCHSRGAPLDQFSQEDVDNFRSQMVRDILTFKPT